MSDLSSIQSILRQIPDQTRIQENRTQAKPLDQNAGEPGFAEVISDFLHSVDDKQSVAEGKADKIVQGESQDLLGAMTSMEESRLSFQLLLEIRNRLLESFKEIQRMQI